MEQTQGTAPRIIDWEEALRLANNNHELAKEMLQLLAERLPKDRDEIIASFKTQDLPGSKTLTHKLRGALCYCGVPRLRQVVEELDNALKQNMGWGDLAELVQKLNYEVDILLDVVKHSE